MSLTKSFVTGSRAYGRPTEDSDVDLVVLVSQADFDRLCEAAENGPEQSETFGDSASLKFGDLNLIVTTSENVFRLWLDGTKELKARRPVTRDEAVKHFRKLRMARCTDDL